jgi:catechol 2,3-dioxygenase-like lactoylglutathione lyase family enzyme
MINVTGIDHIYLTVSDMARAQRFYDALLRDTLGFRTSAFALGGHSRIVGVEGLRSGPKNHDKHSSTLPFRSA